MLLNRINYCQTLGLPPSATHAEIKEAYHDLVKVWHPDRFTHDAQIAQKAQEKLKEINEAYAQLKRMPEAPGAAGASVRPHEQPFRPPAARARSKDTFWESPLLAFLVVLLGMTLLALVMHVFHKAFQGPVSDRSIQSIV